MLKKRIIFFCIIVLFYLIVGMLVNSMRTPMTNEAALMQLDDSNGSLVAWNLYQKIWVVWQWSWMAIVALGIGMLRKPIAEAIK